jgi:hypothetical protein
VELIEGHGEHYWPRPGRIFAAARSHTFRDLGDAIDDAFARWDRSHLQDSPSPARLGCASPTPDKPLPYWGWGDIPDQYRRRWEDDDGQSPMPPDPSLADLPSLQPHWGRAASAQGRD